MARARSPEYPAISLKEAIDRAKLVYDKDYQNRLPTRVIAEHMGYSGLSGASLPVIAALGKYGLLEGRGDETRVSDLAVAIIAHAPGTPERITALKQAATSPDLFAEIEGRFPGGASDQAIRSYLLTNKFIPGAADAAIRAYRDTKALVDGEAAGYTPPHETPEQKVVPTRVVEAGGGSYLLSGGAKVAQVQVHEAFNLDEGPVTLSVPAVLSPESYQDMADRIEIFMRGLKRRSDAEAARRRQDRDDAPE
jgi:hypothetical protein